MIAFLIGKIEHHTSSSVFINVHGVGYEVSIPLRLKNEYPLGQEKKIFTYLKIAEDAHSLFGFASLDDVHLFKTLISVSGIGAKSAMQMLEMPPSQIAQAIESEDINALTKIPGLGKKTASRLILELKGKVVRAEEMESKYKNPSHETAMEILKSLGFSNAEIEKLFATLPEEIFNESEEELVKWGLKNLR